MRYYAWIGEVIQRPFGSVAAAGLSLATVGAMLLAFALLGETYVAALPPGRYPRAVLALPFVLATGAAFFALSPLFHALHLHTTDDHDELARRIVVRRR